MTFLMERLSIERSSIPRLQSRQKLLDISRAMLENTVYLWLQRDRFNTKLHDYDYMLMCYGMPSAGILCVELLKSMKQTNKMGGEPEENVRLPRSEVVQNLSLLVGFLDWVRPSAGNYRLCRRMKQIIQRILDMVLDPNPNPRSVSTEAMEKRPSSEQQLRFPQPNLTLGEGRPNLLNEQEQFPHEVGNSQAAFDLQAMPDPSQGYAGYNRIQNGSEMAYSGTGSIGFGTGSPATLNDNFSSMLDAGLENLDWLDTVDWTRGPWIDLN